MGHALSYTTPWGRTWHLIEENWVTGLLSGGIEGLVGEAEDVVSTTPGVPGQILDSQDTTRMTGSLRVTIGPDGDLDAGQVWAQFRGGFSRHMVGTLTLTSPHYGVLSTQVRLSGILPPPDVEPNDEGLIDELRIPLVSDEGLWLEDTRTGVGVVTVHNTGDTTLTPRIRWSGAGGPVTLPSGAIFTLPAVTKERILLLSAIDSLAVLTPFGEIDYTLMRQMQVLPEAVPDQAERTFLLPVGATLEWQIGRHDPWAAPQQQEA